MYVAGAAEICTIKKNILESKHIKAYFLIIIYHYLNERYLKTDAVFFCRIRRCCTVLVTAGTALTTLSFERVHLCFLASRKMDATKWEKARIMPARKQGKNASRIPFLTPPCVHDAKGSWLSEQHTGSRNLGHCGSLSPYVQNRKGWLLICTAFLQKQLTACYLQRGLKHTGSYGYHVGA